MVNKLRGLFYYISYMNQPEKRIFWSFVAFQFLTGIFELLAISIAGLAITIVSLRISGQTIPNYIEELLMFLSVDDIFSISFALALVLTSAALLILKTIIAAILNLKLNLFLAKVTARIASDKIKKFPNLEYEWLKKTEQTTIAYALGTGLTNDLKSILLGISIFWSEALFLFTVFIYLLIVDSVIALTLSLFLGSISYFVILASHNKLRSFGNSEVAVVTRNNTEMYAFLRGYKELRISKSVSRYESRLRAGKVIEANLRARIQWLEQVPKYFLEVLVILIGLTLFSFSGLSSDADWSSSTLLIFSLVIVRAAPSLLRLQTGASLIRFNVTRFNTTESILSSFESNNSSNSEFFAPNLPLTGSVSFENVSFAYSESENLITNLTLNARGPGVTCISGKSGVGKTTILELMCGLLEPTSGKISIDGLKPSQWNSLDMANIYYLPQEVFTYEGSLRENLLLGASRSEPEDADLLKVMHLVGLSEFISKNSITMETVIGRDISLSGGERQRLGFARAILSNAVLLVLDEPTAALDAIAEKQLFGLILQLSLDRNIVLVSHSDQIDLFFEDVRYII